MNDSPARSKRRKRDRMRLLSGGACAVVLAATSIALTGTAHAEADRTITSNTTGFHNGYFFSYWKDNGNVTMNLGAAGQSTVQWNNTTNTAVSKRRNPTSNHTTNYSGS